MQDEAYIEHLGKMERPIPGSSMTNDPESPLPFEKAPKFTNKREALEEIFANMTRPEVYSVMMDSILQGTTVMEITQVLLMEGFRQGQWNPDLFLMLIEPTAYMVMALAERADIDYDVDREGDDLDDEDMGDDIEEKFDRISKKLGSKSKPGVLPKEIEKKIEEMPLPSLLSEGEPEVSEESLIASRG